MEKLTQMQESVPGVVDQFSDRISDRHYLLISSVFIKLLKTLFYHDAVMGFCPRKQKFLSVVIS